MAFATAWLLQRSPNVLLITGTSSVAHLRDIVVGAALALSQADVSAFNSIGRRARTARFAARFVGLSDEHQA
jgi:aryl-alcohol dehydrogenase-like predicted oxidoreductase